MSCKPLRNNTHGRDEEKAHPKAEKDALCEKKVPYLGGEACADQTSSFEHAAEEHDWSCSKLSDTNGGDWGNHQGAADAQRSYKGIFKSRSTGECVVCEIMCQKDTITGVESPTMAVDGGGAGGAHPSVSSVGWRRRFAVGTGLMMLTIGYGRVCVRFVSAADDSVVIARE